jgi:hypothetical protein
MILVFVDEDNIIFRKPATTFKVGDLHVGVQLLKYILQADEIIVCPLANYV